MTHGVTVSNCMYRDTDSCGNSPPPCDRAQPNDGTRLPLTHVREEGSGYVQRSEYVGTAR